MNDKRQYICMWVFGCRNWSENKEGSLIFWQEVLDVYGV
jgi:hypothetical protein